MLVVLHVNSFDGDRTRILAGSIRNIANGDFPAGEIFDPHTLLLESARIAAPRSIYVLGGDRLAKHPRAGEYATSYKTSVSIVGESMIKGLRCVELLIDGTSARNGKKDRRKVWLAPDQNYLPVRTEYIVPWFNDRVPAETAEVSEFREIKPGIWFPADLTISSYWDESVRKGEPRVSGTWRYRMTEVGLSPRHDKAFFSNAPFPPGTLVYEFENGKITKSYKLPDAPKLK